MKSSASSDAFAPIRWIDVIGVVAVAPFALLMGAPVLGYAAGAGAWVLTRAGGHLLERRALASGNPRTVVGLTVATGLGRAWALGLTILLVGLLGAREDGLTAAIVVFVAFTVFLAARIALRPQRGTAANP